MTKNLLSRARAKLEREVLEIEHRTDLTDQQKIDRLTAVIDAINEEGGVANEWLRGEAVFCGDMVEVSLSLPATPQ